MDKYRKLLVHGLNAAIEAGRLNLAPPASEDATEADGYMETTIGGYSSIVAWHCIGHSEVRISVWWKYEHSNHPQANLTGSSRENFRTASPLAKHEKYPTFVGATVSGWLERKTGSHLQGRGADHLFETYLRRGEKENLEALPVPVSDGYKAEGHFFL